MFDPRVQFDSIDDKLSARIVWNSINVQWAKDAIADGLPLKRGASPFYDNNVLLRKANLNFQYTTEELEELVRCKYDILYFAETYCKLVDDTGKRNNIKLRKYQKRLLRSMQTNKFVIILSGRQIGKTTTTAIYILWKLLFHSQERIALLGDKLATAGENLSKITAIMYELPFFLKPGLKGFNKSSLSIDNESSIFIGPCTKSSLVGKSLTCLYIDELDIPLESQSTELVEYALPTIAAIKTGQAIFSSTPSVGGIFKRIFFAALEKQNAFKAEQVNWWEVDGRDIEWKQNTLKMYGKDAFNVQFNCRFLSSNATIFNEDFIESLERNNTKYVEYAKLFDNAAMFNVLEHSFEFTTLLNRTMIAEKEPINYFYVNKSIDIDWQNDKFIWCCDLAEGIGSDDTVFNCFRINISKKEQLDDTPITDADSVFDFMADDRLDDFDDPLEDYNIILEQVALFKSNTNSLKTAAMFLRAMTTQLCNINNCKISVEYNKYGQAFINYLLDDRIKLPIVELESIGTTTIGERQKLGVHLSASTKKMYVNDAKNDLESGRIVISDNMSINQLKYFGQNKNGSFSAANGHKDDITMTIVNLAAYASKFNEDYINFIEDSLDAIDSNDDFMFGSS